MGLYIIIDHGTTPLWIIELENLFDIFGEYIIFIGTKDVTPIALFCHTWSKSKFHYIPLSHCTPTIIKYLLLKSNFYQFFFVIFSDVLSKSCRSELLHGFIWKSCTSKSMGSWIFPMILLAIWRFFAYVKDTATSSVGDLQDPKMEVR